MTPPDADSTALAGAAGGPKIGLVPLHPPGPSSPKTAPAKTKNIQLSPAVLDAARKEGEELLRDLRTSPDGLTHAEAEERLRTIGPNEVAQEKPQGWPIRLLKIVRNPLVILLATLSAISFATGDSSAGTVMAMMVALSVGFRFLQEARADAAAAKLKAMIHVTATIIRDGQAKEVPLRDLVHGDIIQLSAGDMIPGDVRILSSKDLFVNQGSLTGESFPAEKFHDAEADAVTSPTELKNEEYSQQARKTVARANLGNVLNPAEWEKFAFFALVKPSGDVLPIRALYNEDGSTNIGLNPLTSKEPIWYAGPDLVASRLLSGRKPRIIKAFRVVPHGIQPGLKSVRIGTRQINPETDDFFRAVIEERKKLPKSHPHYLLLKIIANALYGIFAELNKEEYGQNRKKDLEVFSGDFKKEEKNDTFERPGKFQFPPAAALITAGGRLMLAVLEKLVQQKSGNYLLTDTDSMLFVASEHGGLFSCPGAKHKMPDGTPAMKAISWKEVDEICSKLNRLNPYSRELIPDILKIEDSNFDRNGKQHQLHGLAVSAKRYVVYKRQKENIEIIKPSEHGLGIVFVPDKRPRYKSPDCKDQDTDYARWIVEAWERLLTNHFRNLEKAAKRIHRGFFSI